MQAPTSATALSSAASLAAAIEHGYFLLMVSKVKVEVCEGYLPPSMARGCRL
jgi:hypothetical protein